MKKLLALVLAMLLALGCCAAFAEAEPITLDVIICQYGPNTQDWFLGKGMNGTNFVDKFEAENPGIKLNLQVVSWNDVYTEVSTRISNNNAPDILNIDVFANYAAEGLLLPVSDYCPEELFKDFFPSFIEQSVVDGTCWAVPDLASARALYVNQDILNEVGVEVPTTWAELEDVCQAIVDFYNGDVYPWGIDMTTDEGQAAFSYYVWNNDGGFVDADGKVALNSDKNVEAIEFAIGLYNKGFTNPNPATQTRYDLQDMFGAGKLAMVIAPNQLPSYLADKGYTVNFATAALPTNEGATPGATGVMQRGHRQVPDLLLQPRELRGLGVHGGLPARRQQLRCGAGRIRPVLRGLAGRAGFLPVLSHRAGQLGRHQAGRHRCRAAGADRRRREGAAGRPAGEDRRLIPSAAIATYPLPAHSGRERNSILIC